MGELGRRPLTLVEIDLPYCTRTYGALPCRAALAPATFRTNLALWSQDFDNAVWAVTNITRAANTLVAPDGTTTGDTYTGTAANSNFRQTFVKAASAIQYTISIYVQVAAITNFAFTLDGGTTANRVRATYDLSVPSLRSVTTSGTFTGGTGEAPEDVGGGWYRLEATVTTDTATALRFLCTYSGSGIALALWRAQLEYGDSASTAKATTDTPVSEIWGTGAAKCFNSRFTCQDPANYEAGTKTVTYGYNEEGLPDAPGVYPALQSVSSRPGELNLSGIDPQAAPLGKRARVTVRLQDFADNDTWLDQYQSERVSGAALLSGVGYEPLNRGRHLARTFARFPYYLGVPVRVRRGYVGDVVATMPTEHYVMAELKGPGAAGVVTVMAKDVLDLADDAKAVYPSASLGKLLAGIAADDTTCTLSPEGVGDDDYAASGLVRIGREIMGFTRTADVLTLTRAQEGTEAADHSELDVVQECGVLDGLSINVAAETVLKYKTTAFDALIPTADWQEENDNWYAGLTIGRVIISKPTGKNQLVGELCQLGCMIWWDAVAQEAKFKINAPLLPGETYYSVTDETGLLEGTPDLDKAEDQRISSLWLYHGVRDWTDDAFASRNFNKVTVAAVSENLYGQDAIKEIFTRWFGRAGDDGTANIITERLLARYKDTPNIVSGTLDVKDRADVALGSRIEVETYVLLDVDGAMLVEPMQVNYAEYADDRVKFRAETYRLDGRFAFWLDDGTAPADYESATEAQRATGAFWGDAGSPGMPDGTGDYVWF